MLRVGFEPKIPVFEWTKTVHALDRAAAVIGMNIWINGSIPLRIINLSVDRGKWSAPRLDICTPEEPGRAPE
jgi:hypothetical protein